MTGQKSRLDSPESEPRSLGPTLPVYDDGNSAAAAAEGKEQVNTPPIRERTPRREKENDHSRVTVNTQCLL